LLLTLKDDHGLPIEKVRQGTLTMSPPSKGFERLVMSNAIEHGNNPMATWMARNAVVRTDAQNNIIPDKDRAADKIDGIVAAIIAYAGATFARVEPPKASKYETVGMVVIG
jgi:phage terminase large subunit-like protein